MLFMQQLDFILAMRKCGHNRLLALKERDTVLLERMLKAHEWQAAMMAQAMEEMEEEGWVLDTILAMADTFMLLST
ncbi:hypothetical protein Y1Q_0015288 [Alligator mississippiensis]|uniref:Uncharacterized protein n=1 Tax=Alligator mississippiensis TaxID=8496 RepID=A0A151P3X3_ALLMI|nr:hypothetical protein Y1Q_0015288 [Alligator mississippiensis]